MLYRFVRLLKFPFSTVIARLYPVWFARRLGVRMNGKVTIYGSSYSMFSAEPFLVTLGDNVFISVDAKFICHDGGVLPFRNKYPTLDLAAPITLGSNIFVGMGAVILKGVTIGNDCIIGAYSVVTKDVPDDSIVAGNPARIVKRTAAYLETAQGQSLGIGHMTGYKKLAAYRRIFGLDGPVSAEPRPGQSTEPK
jgi:acetyltransferase-like isoleucine patch superfamily enzyme